ncbi:cadherin-23-like [Lynx canadensis]|uniref:cadherin-23-like n=1 Tax=Lynx canadensis TaxID=61383 RepID=UPI0013C4EE7E|nr:cadherin-23-like [Lynx canadensis]
MTVQGNRTSPGQLIVDPGHVSHVSLSSGSWSSSPVKLKTNGGKVAAERFRYKEADYDLLKASDFTSLCLGFPFREMGMMRVSAVQGWCAEMWCSQGHPCYGDKPLRKDCWRVRPPVASAYPVVSPADKVDDASALETGSSVTQLLARDMDNDPLVFGVSGEEASRFFAVEPDTGVVWLRQPLDRETKSEFTVEFSVSDHQGVITRKVNIQVGDVNDNAPTFHNQPYSVRIPENTPVGTPIFIVNATDPDLGAGGSVLYSFQPPSLFFAIDSARGIVTVIRELDYETTQAYQLTVNATDQDKTRPLSTLANLAIIITDVQDMDPIFINLPYSTNIYEHSPPGTTVRVITAIDQDKGRPRGIGYTIVSGNTNSIFALDYISGALTLNGLLDRENPLYSHGFILTVKGTELNDDRTPSDATVTTTFNILVIDINDNAPEFNSSEYSVAITELAQVGFALPLFIQVVDKDENLGLNSMFEVYLVGNNSQHFIISPTSVQGKADIRIRVAVPLDYETVDRYDFDLFANESVPDHVGYAKVKIALINENDNRPIFSQPLYNVSLYENVTLGTSVLTVLPVAPLAFTKMLLAISHLVPEVPRILLAAREQVPEAEVVSSPPPAIFTYRGLARLGSLQCLSLSLAHLLLNTPGPRVVESCR